MKIPAIPLNEESRLQRLDALGLVHSPAEERFDRITRLAQQIFSVPIALVSLVTAKCQWFKSAQGLLASETAREISFCGHAILGKDTFIVPDTLLDPDFADNPLVTDVPHIRFYAGHPVFYNGSAIGTLCIIDTVPRQLTPAELESLRSLAGFVESEFKVSGLSEVQNDLITQLDEVKREVLIDPLTKVWNRRGMDELLPRELERCQRSLAPLALMLIDLDHFKQVNDQFGHPAGDVTLNKVAQRIRSSVRPQDVVVRYGGDEFLVLLGNCTVDTAQVIAQRILMRVSSEPIKYAGREISASSSIGIATVDLVNRGLGIKRIIMTADEALYEVKAAGRGTVGFKIC